MGQKPAIDRIPDIAYDTTVPLWPVPDPKKFRKDGTPKKQYKPRKLACATRKDLQARNAGEFNGRSKLTYKDVAKIKMRLAAGEKQVVIALDYGVSQTVISNINRGATWIEPQLMGR